ncbi:MAG: type VI secretion system tip protein VgrG [Pseudomonadota bacterium]
MSDTAAGSLVTFEILVNGLAIPESTQIQSVITDQSINGVSRATISILDGDPATESFAVSASDIFVPGNKISIAAGYDGRNASIFLGIICKQTIHGGHTGPILNIECQDEAVKMTVGRHSRSWTQSSDSDAMKQIIGSYGLENVVSDTVLPLPTLVQYYVSDWDFIVSRAAANGMLVTAINNTVSVFDPTKNSTPVLTATYGVDILNFTAELNALSQLGQVSARSWDYPTQSMSNAMAQNTRPGPGNISSKTLSMVAAPDNFVLQTATAESQDVLSAWAQAQMSQSQLAKITGAVNIAGSSLPGAGKYLALQGVGARFNGEHFISRVRHAISGGNWHTEISIGLPAKAEQQSSAAPQTAGLLPGIGGMYNAVVKQIANDPANEYRILVDVPLFDDNSGVWARLASFYAGNGQGTFFMPEIGDEVVLGFLNQDPRYPVILGSLYSQANKPSSMFSPQESNAIKGIVSKSDLRVLFDDQNKILSLHTPKGNKVVLDDNAGGITISDQNGNSLVMSSSGISIKSVDRVSVESSQNISIKGQSGIVVACAGGDVSIFGVNIQQRAQSAYSASGDTSAGLSSSGETKIQGTLVMIN